jgi:hypothetical protein
MTAKDTKFRPGERPVGRQKGTPNKATASIKAAFVEAFDNLGGVKALVNWAKDNPTEFYRLASKLIPTEVHANVAVRDVRAEEMGDDDLARIAAGGGEGTTEPTRGAVGPSQLH